MGVSGGDMERQNGNDQRHDRHQARTHHQRNTSGPNPLAVVRVWRRARPRYRKWVLHDLTSRTRWVRHLARAVVQVVPAGALVLLVFGSGWIT
jgi:hypothetical protein